MLYPKIPLAQSLIELFRQKEIEHIVISPGSRNAPLTIGFASNPNFKCYSIADERSAAFFALGMAQQLQKPVAVVCTSGSAVLNYYPALAEAFYSQIPLIVVSADRPLSKIDIGDGQTIRQQNVFANHILYNANLDEEASERNDQEICKAIDIAQLKKGPVHINIPFEEPLYDTVDELSYQPIVATTQKEKLPTKDISDFISIWNNSKKKLILVGVNAPSQIDAAIVEHLANDPSVVVMTETTSNLHHPSFINKIDVFITPFDQEQFEELQPELLLTFGGMIISKRIKSFLRKYQATHHWHIDEFRAYDTFGSLSHHFREEPNVFFKHFLAQTKAVESNYNSFAQVIKTIRKTKSQEFLANAPYSDFSVFEQIAQSLPSALQLQLQISNSSAIRYLQLFDLPPSVEVFCNRGTSGIDGSTSTAVGAALVSKKPVVLITGDVGFFYDSNALWNNYTPKNFKIILINNAGGGIFRILPGHQKTELFSTFFETKHNLNASHLAKMFGFNYFHAQNELEVQVGLENFIRSEGNCILEIATPTTVNDVVLSRFFKALS